jgi:hypothetical protein
MSTRVFCQRNLRPFSFVCVGTIALLQFISGSRTAWTADDKTVEQIQGDERIEVLRFLASHNEANYRKIETWRGKYHFIDRLPQKIQLAIKQKSSPQQFEMRDVIMIREGTMEFALDVAADKLWSEYQEDASKTKFLSLDGREEITPNNYQPVNEKEILTADRLTKLSDMRYGPLPHHPDDPNHVRKSSSRLARVEAYGRGERIRDLGERLDPRRFYSTGTVPMWEKLNSGIRALTGGDGAERRELVSRYKKIIKSGLPGEREYKVTMRYFSGPTKEEQKFPLEVTRFAEQNQYLPIEYILFRQEGGHIHQYRSWIYQNTNGALIPKEFHLIFNGLEDGKLILDRHLRFVEGVLNEPLPEETFSTDHLGLTKGERLEDKVENRLYVSVGDKLLPAPQYAAAIASEKYSAWWWLLVWFSGALLIALASLWVRRRLRSLNSEKEA